MMPTRGGMRRRVDGEAYFIVWNNFYSCVVYIVRKKFLTKIPARQNVNV